MVDHANYPGPSPGEFWLAYSPCCVGEADRQAGREGERGHSNESTLASSEEEAHLMR